MKLPSPVKMKFILVFLFIFSVSIGVVHAQEVEVIKYPELERLMNERNDRVKVFNFWATWCKPCIKELPYFEALQQQYPKEELQVYLISFDDVENLESRVKPFIEKRKIGSTVKLLDETDYNAFIDKIDPSWSGAIPATLIIAGDKRQFVEGELDEAQLKNLIEKVKNTN